MPRNELVLSLLVSTSMALSACGGGGGSSSAPVAPGGGVSPPPPPVPTPVTKLETPNEVSRFMIQAGFGASFDEINTLTGTDAESWISTQFSQSPTAYLQPVLDMAAANDIQNDAHSDAFWTALLSADDVLRQRMVFALSQIFVISDRAVSNEELAVSYYQDILSKNAFGNFRDLLQDITYSPVMAEFLTYLQNEKGDPDIGRTPDENYARELLQLFTIGLVELNLNGTPKDNGAGPIEVFGNEDVAGLARVFTGLGHDNDRFYRTRAITSYIPLKMFASFHSPLEKKFLGTTIPAGTSGDQSISLALDAIFEHENVAPFISRQLIQRFTASDPDPLYVSRVATAFNAGTYNSPNGTMFGEGRRGDLSATLAAILLDESVHQDPSTELVSGGKIREPILKFAQWSRNFQVSNQDVEPQGRLSDTSNPSDRLAQHPFRSPSVFNFYRPGFIAPGTESGAASLTTPELQIITQGASVGYVNFMTDFIYDRTILRSGAENFLPDYSAEINIANDTEALVDRLNLLMTASQMSADEKAAVKDVLDSIDLTSDDDREKRVEAGILMVASLPSYAVIR